MQPESQLCSAANAIQEDSTGASADAIGPNATTDPRLHTGVVAIGALSAACVEPTSNETRPKYETEAWGQNA